MCQGQADEDVGGQRKQEPYYQGVKCKGGHRGKKSQKGTRAGS